MVFAFSTWTSNRMFAAARHDSANRDVSVGVSQSAFDRYVPFAFVGTLVVLGGVVHLVGSDGATGIACAALANLLLLTQGALIQYYWRRWVGGQDS